MTNANAIPEKYQDIAEKLITASLADSAAYNRLAYVCDTFGPRLSGSDNLENAIDWILEEMEQDGFSNVRGEKVKVPVWIRGKESARLIKPFAKDLAMLGLGGSIGTPRAGIRTRAPSALINSISSGRQTSLTVCPASASLTPRSDPYDAPRIRILYVVPMIAPVQPEPSFVQLGR